MVDERVNPGKTHISNVQKHIARYNVALQYCGNVDVLDIACGTGYGTQMISRVAKSVVGVDNSKEAINIAKLHYNNDNIEYKKQDFYDVEGKFDTIVCFETIEHLADLKKTQNKLLTLLKPGGIIVFSVPLNEEKGFNKYHLHTFTTDTARELFKDLTNMGELMQIGVNFFETRSDWKQNFTYFIAVKKLT